MAYFSISRRSFWRNASPVPASAANISARQVLSRFDVEERPKIRDKGVRCGPLVAHTPKHPAAEEGGFAPNRLGASEGVVGVEACDGLGDGLSMGVVEGRFVGLHETVDEREAGHRDQRVDEREVAGHVLGESIRGGDAFVAPSFVALRKEATGVEDQKLSGAAHRAEVGEQSLDAFVVVHTEIALL